MTENTDRISNENFRLIMLIGSSLSIILNILLYLSINKRQSTYAKMIRNICLGEAIYIFSFTILCLEKEVNVVKQIFCYIEWVLLLNQYII